MKKKYLVPSLLTFVFAIGTIHPVVTKADFEVQIFNRTTLYDSPNLDSQTYGTLAPQNVTAIQDAAQEVLPLTPNPEFNRWYQINTYLGPKWITNKFSAATQEIIKDDRKIGILERKVLYESPSKFSATYGTIAPQIVNQISRIDPYLRLDTGWYQINTYLGPKWIEVSDETSLYGTTVVPKEGTTTEKLTISERTNIYDSYKKDSVYDKAYLFSQEGTLAPQTLNVIQVYGNLVQVQTYLGPMWLTFDDETMNWNTRTL
ncbi:hypothetical protein U8V72_10950 [Priestia filamentosa]|uniref:hypothetical protein n=1 Tax=Priestia filamentosa TaxID=1402861 RepID=UPI00397DC1BC